MQQGDERPASALQPDGFMRPRPAERNVPAALLIVAILAVVAGVFFRFYHLDRKVYSGDEVYTTLRMLGDTEAALDARSGDLRDAHDLWLILHPTPPQGAADVLAPARALAAEEPHHPPIYYLLGHLWLGVFGNSIAATRALSAVISLFALPLAFWLGVELYDSRRAGWLALALFALSPVVIVYAQEAREYSLWTVAILALNIALLRAIRLDRPADWWLVAALTTFALYVYPFTILVIGGLAAYMLATQWTNRRLLLRCGLAFAAGTLAFLPWALILLQHLRGSLHSFAVVLQARLSPSGILRSFAGLLRLNIYDDNRVRSSGLGVATTAGALLVFGWAVAFVARRERPRVSLFLILPLLATTLPILVSDLFGGGIVRLPRYFTPCYLYLEYCLVGLLAAMIGTRKIGRPVWGYAFLIILLGARTASVIQSAQAMTWWNKMQDNSIAVARTVDRSARPLIVSDADLLYALALSNYLRPDVAVAMRSPCYECADHTQPKLDAGLIPPGHFTDLFELGPSERLQTVMRNLMAHERLSIAYHCINIRNNCASDLNIEPVFAPVESLRQAH
jgi:uncharacterized membrane protein